jgi:hypothetical protein
MKAIDSCSTIDFEATNSFEKKYFEAIISSEARDLKAIDSCSTIDFEAKDSI